MVYSGLNKNIFKQIANKTPGSQRVFIQGQTLPFSHNLKFCSGDAQNKKPPLGPRPNPGLGNWQQQHNRTKEAPRNTPGVVFS